MKLKASLFLNALLQNWPLTFITETLRLQQADAIMRHVNEESSISEEEHFDNVDRAEFPMGYKSLCIMAVIVPQSHE